MFNNYYSKLHWLMDHSYYRPTGVREKGPFENKSRNDKTQRYHFKERRYIIIIIMKALKVLNPRCHDWRWNAAYQHTHTKHYRVLALYWELLASAITMLQYYYDTLAQSRCRMIYTAMNLYLNSKFFLTTIYLCKDSPV